MKPKFRLFACVMAAVLCTTAFSMTAFASGGDCYESDESGKTTPPSSIDSISVSTEGVKLPENSGSEALTPDGNLSLIDDIQQVESYASDESELKDKQFITVQSKNGNYFYIVIDRSGDTENVYFLNLVDEADLMALMEDADGDSALVCTCKDKCAAGDVDTNCPVCKNNMSECAGKEADVTTPEPDATTEPDTDPVDSEKSSNSGLLLIVLVLALAGGGAVYWFKFRKKKPDTKGAADLDDYDYGDDDDEEYETEADEPEEADAEDKDK
ncbi:MAG: DUF4366 domain-containing protein [Oscillospiraceae bacterium]|nr:DUF4366 domain-containing protein [Oscillospiraceae bacterium]